MLRKSDEALASILVKNKVLQPEQLEQVRKEQEQSGEDMATVILRRGLAASADVMRCVAEQLVLPYVELGDYTLDQDAVHRLPKEIAYQCHAIPLFLIGNVLTVATSTPGDVSVIDKLRRTTRLEIEPAISSPEEIRGALEEQYGPLELIDDSFDEVVQKIQDEQVEETQKSEEALKQIAEDAPVIKLVNLIIGQAIRDGASDVHICPEESQLMVRYRIDGILHEAFSPPKNLQAALTSRIKILAELDIAESRIPQDGRCQASFEGKAVDLRVSTLPTVYGENIVMRILDKSSLMLNLGDIGLSDEMLERLQNILGSSYGIILVTGPTGSGKTTTLYSCLNALNTPDKNIITLEDPVEYRLKGIRQSQVNAKAGMSFAAGLRSILRQDPDIIMVGEIRDSETAKIAVESALTGHLVLSTLHTNDAAGAISRLTEMEVEPFLVASAAIGVIAQRLVRKICGRCKESYTPSRELLRELRLDPAKREWVFYRGEGCTACKNTGYKGRLGIYEIMTINEELRELCLKDVSSDILKRAAVKGGMRTLRQDGFIKMLKGLTSVEEVIRVTNADA